MWQIWQHVTPTVPLPGKLPLSRTGPKSEQQTFKCNICFNSTHSDPQVQVAGNFCSFQGHPGTGSDLEIVTDPDIALQDPGMTASGVWKSGLGSFQPEWPGTDCMHTEMSDEAGARYQEPALPTAHSASWSWGYPCFTTEEDKEIVGHVSTAGWRCWLECRWLCLQELSRGHQRSLLEAGQTASCILSPEKCSFHSHLEQFECSPSQCGPRW